MDVLIIGGGLVGLTLALMLQSADLNAKVNLKITLIDQKSPENFLSELGSLDSQALDTRTLALSFSSVQILKSLDSGELWKKLAPVATAISHLHISEAGTSSLLRLHAKDYLAKNYAAKEEVEAAFGYVVPIVFLYRALWETLQKNLAKNLDPGGSHIPNHVEMECPAKVLSVNPELGEVVLDNLDNHKTLKADLILACDGGNSFVRESLGLKTEVKDYEQSALVTSVTLSQPHDNWAFERFLSDGVLALLPLQAGKKGPGLSGLVWVQSTQNTEKAMQDSDENLIEKLQKRFGRRLGDFLALGPRHTYPLKKVVAKEVFFGRVLLMGNAAHQLNPIGAQGWNLALRDMFLLKKLIEKNLNPQNLNPQNLNAESLHPENWSSSLRLNLFEPYVAATAKDQTQIERMTDGMATLYGAWDPLSVLTRRSVMAGLKLSAFVREELVLTLMGKKAYWEIF
jgi:2-octaprenyl-6-methoxyphenol hydroxylase